MARLRLRAAVLLVGLLTATSALAGPGDDEANRQRMMADMRRSDANTQRENFNSQERLRAANERTYGSSGSSGTGTSGGSGGGYGYTPPAQYKPPAPRDVITYTFKIHVQETPTQAVARLEQEAAAGNSQSAFDAARILYTGYGGAPHDEARARRWFGEAAKLGHAPAQTQYGMMLQNGIGGPVDHPTAMTWLKAAAAQGDSYGQALYGFFSLAETSRRDADSRNPEAILYLTEAADRGEMVAQAALGLSYYLGTAAPQDFVKARHYEELAAAQGYPGAMSDLASIWLYGHGVAADPVKAAGWARKAAEAGDAHGMDLWGRFLLGGSGGVAKDEAAGLQWLGKAADKGDPQACGLYASLLIEGRLLPQDFSKGARLALVSARAGDITGEIIAAKVYYFGQGVPKDLKESARWFRLAAAQGNAEASEALKEPELVEAARGL